MIFVLKTLTKPPVFRKMISIHAGLTGGGFVSEYASFFK